VVYTDSNYEALIASFFSQHHSVQAFGFSESSFNPGIAGIAAFDERLGSPSATFKTIHVAGTNGKGSVCSMLAASLSASGLKVGLYTSPHLLDFRERISLLEQSGLSLISKEDVFNFLSEHLNSSSSLSFFDITTEMAFWWFSSQKVDIAIIEVGLGGRIDSTNIIVPELSIITSIGLDHCAILGDTLAKIAYEKAGIFKSGVPALVAYRDDETSGVFEAVSSQVHCPLFFAEDFNTRTLGLDLEGPCQAVNLRTVLAAHDLLGIEPSYEALANTARLTSFHGRWERLNSSPEVICDIGHNPPALEINFRRLKESGRPLFIVYGIMADKDLASISRLFPSAAKYFLVAPETPRALPVKELDKSLMNLRPDIQTIACTDIASGINLALGAAGGADNSLVYIGGSTFVVSEAILYFARK